MIHYPHFPSLKRLFLWMALILSASSPVLQAQHDSLITASPNAKLLRRAWTSIGYGAGAAGVGLGDINGDGINDFAMCSSGLSPGLTFWHIYSGNTDSIGSAPMLSIRVQRIGQVPIVGKFWGASHGAGLVISEDPSGYPFSLRVFRIDSGRIDTTSATVLSTKSLNPQTSIYSADLFAVDLDQDGADELVLSTKGLSRNGVLSQYAEIWIYKGGAGFQLDTPTVILHDHDRSDGSGRQIFVGNFDDDGKSDIMVVDDFQDQENPLLRFWFSKSSSPWSWDYPHRTVMVHRESNSLIETMDCDGDGRLDIAVPVPEGRLGIFRTSAGKSINTRTFKNDDIDNLYVPPRSGDIRNMGFIADSTRRYAMVGVISTTNNDHKMILGMQGGPNGPDAQYDYYYSAEFDTAIFNPKKPDYSIDLTVPVGDVTGDGWDDLLGGNSGYNSGTGIAYILAGGPDIPSDPSAEVGTFAVKGRASGLSIWPLPARDELHIAWRGDLKKMPSRFVIHDILGQEIANGSVESWQGEALWRCADVSVGTYFLSVFDEHGDCIATVHISKL